MPHDAHAHELFFVRAGLDRDNVRKIVAESLTGADDGELFLEYRQSETLVLDDRQIKAASFDTTQGFGLRSVAGEAQGYAHSSEISEAAIRRAATTVQAVKSGRSGHLAPGPVGTNAALYTDLNPLALVPFEDKVKLLEEIDAYARGREPRIKQVSASLAGSWQAVYILRADGTHAADIRPLVRINVSVVLGHGDRMETGSHGMGGRFTYDGVMSTRDWRNCVDEALRQASVNLESINAPAGEMSVVLGPGWPGVMLHEAVGHGLEGDFNRKGTSAFSGMIGKQVAAKGVTVVDDGSIPDRRGSITIDDEGTPSSRTTLIEDGILVGYLQDRLNARLSGVAATGNGRRQSYAHPPLPRMTNTFMVAGDKDPGEILASVKKGIYAVNFGGGQVDITSGKFVFAATEAYLIENGKIGPAVKGATLIGNGPDALTRVSMIGNDLQLDPGIGVCGKDGQGVPVGVGQPTLRLDGLTVGGTAV
ncbi:MAG: metalloprotease TldD [Rhodospirillaceae bacterium]|nr:metalloprotease TldD [Rhodospirillales bacterium]